MNAAVSEETKALVENLRIKAAMIDFGEKIEWGSDAALMREAATFIESLATPVPGAVSNAMVEHMVSRFLQWRLPENFNPDGGISFQSTSNAGTPYAHTFRPVGTNLFDHTQATAMVRHMLEGLPVEALATPVPGAVSNAMVERARKAADDAWMKWTGGRSPLDGMHFFVRAALEAAVQSVGVREATDDQT